MEEIETSSTNITRTKVYKLCQDFSMEEIEASGTNITRTKVYKLFQLQARCDLEGA